MKKKADMVYEKTKPKQTQFKPNSNPIKANFRKAKMNLKSLAGKSGHTSFSSLAKKAGQKLNFRYNNIAK